MNNLYNLTGDFVELFDKFDEIDNYEPDWDENGNQLPDRYNSEPLFECECCVSRCVAEREG